MEVELEMKPCLRPYANMPFFEEMNDEQRYRYEERIGMLVEDGPWTDLAHDIAFSEAKGYANP